MPLAVLLEGSSVEHLFARELTNKFFSVSFPGVMTAQDEGDSIEDVPMEDIDTNTIDKTFGGSLTAYAFETTVVKQAVFSVDDDATIS